MQRLVQPDAQQQVFQRKTASGMLPSDATKQIYGQMGDVHLPAPRREGGLLPRLINNFKQGQGLVQ